MLHAGLDLSRRKLDVCLLSERGEHLRAEGDPKSRDAIGDAVADGVVDDRGAKEFAQQMDQADLLSADDLAPDGPFARAALISQLVVWEPAAGVESPDRSVSASGTHPCRRVRTRPPTEAA